YFFGDRRDEGQPSGSIVDSYSFVRPPKPSSQATPGHGSGRREEEVLGSGNIHNLFYALDGQQAQESSPGMVTEKLKIFFKESPSMTREMK
ncbi:hypothetical protein HAX54_044749, partial [Datura stramonium]|nr:hypothetical protein [Datura stramonium]